MADSEITTNPASDSASEPIRFASNDLVGAIVILRDFANQASFEDERLSILLATEAVERLLDLRGEVRVIAGLLDRNAVTPEQAAHLLRASLQHAERPSEK